MKVTQRIGRPLTQILRWHVTCKMLPSQRLGEKAFKGTTSLKADRLRPSINRTYEAMAATIEYMRI
ncbi:MAG: hypothetical protein B7X88_05780 [Polaromonas sp. 17-63-33]|nr:MAG: hypothetical protein B7X88_05780 [Polaromonas sp. 17-63-33]